MELYEVERNMLVVYIPRHAHGDILHPDVEQGRVTSTNSEYVFVRFGDALMSKACNPHDLHHIWAQANIGALGGSRGKSRRG